MRDIVFYYASKPVKELNCRTVYHCLVNDAKEVVILDSKNFKTQKLYRMNERYQATDEDLFQFRKDLHIHNNEIKQFFFKRKDKTVFKIDVFNHNSTNQAVVNTVLINSDQKKINAMPKVDFKELVMLENCLSCGLMSVDKDKLEVPLDVYSYDFPKFYLYMMKKIRVPTSAPEYFELDALDFDNLDVGYYRVKIHCSNRYFMNAFKFNSKDHYNHNTLKTLHRFKDKYGITFELLKPNKEFSYNMVWYEHTVELKVIMKGWFDIIEKLLKECSKSNWLLKTYISQAWGNLSKYKKLYVNKDDSTLYDWDHLANISSSKYDYYANSFENDMYSFISADDPFAHGGLGRIKAFLTEFSRNYIFNLISEHNLEKFVVRIQTDSISFTKPVDFKALGLTYIPIQEAKSTGRLVFYNVNSYFHVCSNCECEYKYSSKYEYSVCGSCSY